MMLQGHQHQQHLGSPQPPPYMAQENSFNSFGGAHQVSAFVDQGLPAAQIPMKPRHPPVYHKQPQPSYSNSNRRPSYSEPYEDESAYLGMYPNIENSNMNRIDF
jgi:hypothetical protein